MLGRLLGHRKRLEEDLTRREIARGVALRAHACCTRGEEIFFLDVRCLHARKVGGVSLRAHGERGAVIETYYRASIPIEAPDGNDDWMESQFVLKLPSHVATVYIDCCDEQSGVVLCRGNVERSLWHDKLLARFYAKARNPFADGGYGEWLGAQRVTAEELSHQRATRLAHMPLVSLVVPVYRTPPAFLRTMIDSVIAQSYANWELVIVNASPDDAEVASVLDSYSDVRIRVIEHPENDGINGNTNYGIRHAQGDYIGFLDHDDFVEPNLLFEYVRAINENENVSMLYCDEDSFEEAGGFVLPMFKPDMNIDLLYSNNYLLHLLMVSRTAIEETLRAPDETNGAQDYDLTLKAYETAGCVVHVPYVLYHWRIHDASSNAGNDWAKPYVNDGCKEALNAHFERRCIDACAQETDVPYVYRCVPAVEQMGSCFRVLSKSTEERNEAARSASEEFILFGSDDVTPLDSDAIETAVAYFERDEVGIVAPRLLCPDGLSCTQWLVLRPNGSYTCMGHDLPASDGGYNGRFHRPCNVTAVDGTCLLVRRDEFLALGGYDRAYETLAYATIDLCLRYRSHGKLVVFTPFARFEHAQDVINTRMPRLQSHLSSIEHDRLLLLERWPQVASAPDSLYNANLDNANPYFALAH